MSTKKKILFVDDETMVLDGLRRMLRTERDEWDFYFANSGKEALEMMSQEPFDVIVSDMRMPGIDGVHLLNEIKALYPRMIRVALSGQTSKESVIRSVGPIHHYLAKPCHGERLKSALARIRILEELLEVEELRGLIQEMESLPSLPTFYYDLLQEIESPEGSVKKVGEIISRDISMSAKILQLVNSAFFGLQRHIMDPAEAAVVLGLDTIKMLVLVVHVFSVFDQTRLEEFSLQQVWEHSTKVGLFARKIAKAETTDRKLIDSAGLAGMLHDIGKLVLVDKLSGKYAQVLRRVREDGIPLIEAEKEELKATHAGLGGYLLGLWGFSDSIIEAVERHHNPGSSVSQGFSAVTAVHAADAIAHAEELPAGTPWNHLLDEAYIEKCGLTHRVEEWRGICESMLHQECTR
jgi:HD-like signal output (HDOD) protein